MSNLVNYNPNIAVDSAHAPVSGAKAYFYDTGTTTLQTVYTDKALTVAAASPLVADSSGVFATIYSTDTTDLKVVVKDASDVTLYTIDPAVVQSTGGGAATVAFSPTSRIAATDVQAAVVEVDGDVAQLEKDVRTIYATAGSSDAYTVAVSGLTTYDNGNVFNVRADRDNTGAATLNFQSVGAKSWKYYDTSGAKVDYAAGGISQGSEFKVRYDGTDFVTIGQRVPLADTGRAGIVEAATTAEMTAGTAAKYPDAAEVKTYTDGTLVSSTNGYQIFPSGLILQWGQNSVGADSTSGALSFPMAFPNAVWVVVGNTSALNATATSEDGAAAFSISKSQFKVVNAAASTRTIHWLAVGN